MADKYLCVQAASCKEVLLPLPALFDYDTTPPLIMLVSEQTVFAEDFRPIL